MITRLGRLSTGGLGTRRRGVPGASSAAQAVEHAAPADRGQLARGVLAEGGQLRDAPAPPAARVPLAGGARAEGGRRGEAGGLLALPGRLPAAPARGPQFAGAPVAVEVGAGGRRRGAAGVDVPAGDRAPTLAVP